MITDNFLLGKIITHWPKYIIDEYGQGVITPAYYYHRGIKKYLELESNRRKFLNTSSKYTIAFDDLVSGEFGPEFKSLIKEVIVIVDIVIWNKICDLLNLSEDHPLRNVYYLSYDYYSVSSGVFIEIDGEQHEKVPEKPQCGHLRHGHHRLPPLSAGHVRHDRRLQDVPFLEGSAGADLRVYRHGRFPQPDRRHLR